MITHWGATIAFEVFWPIVYKRLRTLVLTRAKLQSGASRFKCLCFLNNGFWDEIAKQ